MSTGNKLFEIRKLNGKKVINPYRTGCDAEHIVSVFRHESERVIDRMLWAEDEVKNLKSFLTHMEFDECWVEPWEQKYEAWRAKQAELEEPYHE